jgi:GAF domain-containing protein/sensor histidine kinase YesM
VNAHGTDIPLPDASVTAPAVRGRLFRKYVALFVGVVAAALLANGLFEIWFSYREHEDALIRIQREQAQAAAAKIEQFVQEIQNQIGWTTQLPWSAGTLEQRRFDALRLLRQVPAITELSQLDATGHEQLRVSRLAMDVVGSNTDFSHDPKFTEAVAHKVYYGPVYFRRESEPYMTLALAGTRRDAGVSVAEVNLKFIWDVVSQIKVGEKGLAYVVDGGGRLIAHPDISLVLRNTDLSRLSQVRAARAGAAGEAAEPVRVARDAQGREVLTAAAPISPLGWFMFVELPINEAYAPLYASIERSAALLAAGLVLAFLAALLLARRMVVPIQALRAGAARLGGGDLGQRIAIKTGDELEALANQFNDMAGRLEESYADLEKKVEDRTKELTESLEQQTATSEVLGVISRSPGDLDSVFNSMLENANRICGADFGVMSLYENDVWRPVGLRSTPPKFAEWLLAEPRRWGPETALGRLEATKQLVHIDDVKADSVYQVQHNPSRVAFVELAGARTLVAVPMLKEDELVGAFCIFRREVRPFTDKQIALVQSFASQAVIAIENARLLSELRESLERQTATSEVLQVISSSPAELRPVFDAVLANATRMCEAAFGVVHLRTGDTFVSAAHIGAPPELVEFHRRRGAFKPLPGGPLDTVLRTGKVFHSADQASDETPSSEARIGGARALLAVPMIKDHELLGAMIIYRQEVRPFGDKQIALVESFAAQAVIAIENARLLSELRESLDQQTATSEVLHVISSSPGELKPVFDAMLANALRLCEAHMGLMVVAEDGMFRPITTRGVPPEFAEFLGRLPPFKPPLGTGTYQMVQEKKTIHVPDAADMQTYRDGVVIAKAFVDLGRARTSLFVPMIKDGEVVGAFQIYRPDVRPFTDKQIAIIESFSSQAVIAIENARLLGELRESLARQTATAEVLQVINSSSGDLKPVFDAMVDKAMVLCEASFGMFNAFEGERFRTVSALGVPEAYARFLEADPPQPGPGSGPARLMAGDDVSHIVDLADSDLYRNGDPQRRAIVDLGGARTILNIALRKDDHLLGMFAIYRRDVRPFSDKQIALMQGFAAQAVVAMENARLLNELRESLEQQTATTAVLSAISSTPGQLEPVFDTILEKTLRLCEADIGHASRIESGRLRLVATRGSRPEYETYLQTRTDLTPTGNAARALAEKRPIQVPDLRSDEAYLNKQPPAVASVELNGVRTALHVPMILDNTAVGLIVVDRREPRAFTDKQIAVVESFASQAVIAIENARLLNEIRTARDTAEKALGELRTAQASLVQSEKMASLGQLTAGIAHEIKNPLNFVNNFAKLSVELLDELKETAAPGLAALDPGKREEVDELVTMLTGNLDKIGEHGRRADGIVKSMLAHSRGGSGDRQTVSINALIDESLNLAYHGVRAQDKDFNVTLERDFASTLPPIEVVPQDITRVFLNLFGNGFYAVRQRQKRSNGGYRPVVKVTTREEDGRVAIHIRDNGIGIPPDVRNKMFEPFFTTKPTGEGTGLGLSISYDIVTQQHGGSISVDSQVDEFTEFTIRLPRNRHGAAATT